MLDKICSYPESQFLELLSEKTTVNEVDRRRTIASCLSPRLEGEASCADDDALVGAADHCAAKVADGIRPDIALVSLTLEKDVEADEAGQSDRSVAVDTAIPTTLGDVYFDKARLA